MAIAQPGDRRLARPLHRCLGTLALLVILGIAAVPAGAQQSTAVPDRPSGNSWTDERPTYFDPLAMSWGDGKWWWTLFTGVAAKTYATEMARGKFDLGGTYIVGAAIGREYGSLGDWFRLEWEAGASFQFGKEEIGDLRFYPLTVRFKSFPWNDYVVTSFAMGYGISWMTDTSRYERRDDIKTAKANAALFAELTFAMPERPDWALMLRLHHRSPIFGLLEDRGDSTDFLTIGLKHRF